MAEYLGEFLSQIMLWECCEHTILHDANYTEQLPEYTIISSEARSDMGAGGKHRDYTV